MSLFEKVREGRNQGWASKQSPSERKEEVGVVDRARVKPVGGRERRTCHSHIDREKIW